MRQSATLIPHPHLGRLMPPIKRRRPVLHTTVDAELHSWVLSNCGSGRLFRGLPEAVDTALLLLREEFAKSGRTTRLDVVRASSAPAATTPPRQTP